MTLKELMSIAAWIGDGTFKNSAAYKAWDEETVNGKTNMEFSEWIGETFNHVAVTDFEPPWFTCRHPEDLENYIISQRRQNIAAKGE